MRKDIAIVTTLCVLAVGTIYGIEQDARHRDKQQFDVVVKVASDEHAVNDKLAGRVAQLEGEVAELRRENDDIRVQRDRARASRSRRLSVQGTPAGHGGSEGSRQSNGPVQGGGWATSVRGIKIANCESADLQHWPYSDGSRYLGGEKGVHLRDPNGHYGKWQFALPTWRSVGGTGNPADASEAEQDMRASMLYARDGETPWSCRLKV